MKKNFLKAFFFIFVLKQSNKKKTLTKRLEAKIKESLFEFITDKKERKKKLV